MYQEMRIKFQAPSLVPRSLMFLKKRLAVYNAMSARARREILHHGYLTVQLTADEEERCETIATDVFSRTIAFF
jgi:hypothetical protein